MFKLVTVADDKVKASLDRATVTFGLLELEYLLLNLPTRRYRLGKSDVRKYVRRTARSKNYVPPWEGACLSVLYDVLF
jgi:hypothetical protein